MGGKNHKMFQKTLNTLPMKSIKHLPGEKEVKTQLAGDNCPETQDREEDVGSGLHQSAGTQEMQS